MEVSTTLGYGFCLEEASASFDCDEERADYMREELFREIDMDGLPEYPDWHGPDYETKRAAYLEIAQARKKEVGIEWAMQGDEYSIDYYLFAYGSTSGVDFGEAEEVKSFEVQPDWEEKMKKWCEVHGFIYREPKWYLVTMAWY